MSWGGVVHVQKEKNEARHFSPALSRVCVADLCRTSGIRKIVWSEVLLCVSTTQKCATLGPNSHLTSVTSARHKDIWICFSHGEHTRWLSHVAHNVNVSSSRKNNQILDENRHFHKKSPLTRTWKNQHGHKNASVLEKSALWLLKCLILGARGVKQD